MADTIQLVTWSLAQACKLRAEVLSNDFEVRPDVLEKARAYSESLRETRWACGVFGGIYVWSYTEGLRPKGDDRGGTVFPADGFVIATEFGPFGGPEALFEMCARCPANTTKHDLAGCYGSLRLWPNSQEAEEQLRSIIGRLGLESEMSETFPATTPIWYGLWAVSPVPRQSLQLLETLISEMLAEDRQAVERKGKLDQRQIRDFSRFLESIAIARKTHLDLHVSLLPLAHTDFGFYTTFPHCPFCKATAQTKRWQRRYPTALQTCRVCGTRFSPAETASSRRMKDEDEELRDQLGEAEFTRFAIEYLMAHGESRESAEAIVRETEIAQREREEVHKKRNELARRMKEFVAAHILAGLPTVPPPQSECDDDDDGKSDSIYRRWYDGDTMEEALRRATALHAKVTMMFHVSATGEFDQTTDRVHEPLSVLAEWRAKGCAEKFQARFIVPEELLPPV